MTDPNYAPKRAETMPAAQRRVDLGDEPPEPGIEPEDEKSSGGSVLTVLLVVVALGMVGALAWVWTR